MSVVKPDMLVAAKFLRHLLGSDDKVCFQTIANKNDNHGDNTYRFGSLTKWWAWLVDQNQQGMGIYFVVNETDGRGRKEENIVSVKALFVDLDGAPLGPIMNCKPRPHIITETSEGRYHAFWRVDDVPLNEFTRLQHELAQKFNSDLQVVDLPRVMRLPGFFHMKDVPFMSRIVEIYKHPTCKKMQIVNGLGLKTGPRKTPELADDKSNYPIPQGQRNRTLVTISGRLRNAGLSEKRLFEALWAENVARCTPPCSEAEVKRIAMWAGRKDSGTLLPARAKVTDRDVSVAKRPIGRIYSWRELRATEFPPVKWIIHDLLPQGLCICAGRPKAGKSWLVQSLCLAVASGQDAMGHFGSNQGSVLSLSLEDTPARFKGRMEVLTQGEALPDKAYFTGDWPALPDCIPELEKWLQEQEDPRLIVIDTLAKVRQNNKAFGEGVYERDYREMGHFQKLAGKYQVAIILVHHERKAESIDEFDSVSGSAGITGAADSMWLLKRPDRNKMEGTLIISGRDISDRQYALRWDESRGLWLYEGKATEASSSKLQQQVLTAIDQIGTPASPTEIITITGKPKATVYRAITALLNDGLIERSVGGRNRYILTQQPIICQDPYPSSIDYDLPPGEDCPNLHPGDDKICSQESSEKVRQMDLLGDNV